MLPQETDRPSSHINITSSTRSLSLQEGMALLLPLEMTSQWPRG